MTECEDRELALKFKKGDRSAFDALVARHRRPLYSVIYRMTRNHAATDDLLQETFLKLFTSINQYDEKRAFFPWLYRIAINNSINYFRKERKSNKNRSIDDNANDKCSEPPDTDNFFNPETRMIDRERNSRILEAIREVSPAYRAAFVLKVFEERSYKEIAEILQCTVGTVMSRLNRARNQLKDRLKDYLKSKS